MRVCEGRSSLLDFLDAGEGGYRPGHVLGDVSLQLHLGLLAELAPVLHHPLDQPQLVRRRARLQDDCVARHVLSGAVVVRVRVRWLAIYTGG